MKINKKSILTLISVLMVAVFVFAGCTGKTVDTNTENTSEQNETKQETPAKEDGKKDVTEEVTSEAPVLGEDVKLDSGEVIKKDEIQQVAEEYIPDSLPKEIESVEDLMKYNDYVESLPDGREKELLLLKMQLFLEQIQ